MPFQIFVHLTWTTLERRRLIDADVARYLGRALPSIATRHGGQLIQLGIVSDHVHVLLGLPHHVDVPRLVQALKGATARIANRDGIASKRPLRWAQGYDLRSVSPGNVEKVRSYVRRQSAHHPERAIEGASEPESVG